MLTAMAQRLKHHDTTTVNLADVISALSYALDITEGQPEGHAARTCLIAMRIAETIGLPIINSRAGAIDIGSRFHVVAVPAEMHEEPVQTFQAFTGDLHRMLATQLTVRF